MEQSQVEHPERIRQPVCQYYQQTGACMFGSACKFHHPIPKDSPRSTERAQFNLPGYPLCPNARDCEFYLRNGWCHSNHACKYNHPEPSNSMHWWHSSKTADQQSNPMAHTSSIANPYWQGPSSYGGILVPQRSVQVPSWNTFPGKLEYASSSERQQQNFANGQFVKPSRQKGTRIDSSASFSYFPMRPDEPDCPFLVTTGQCKFGAGCRFNHPKEKITIPSYCMLSPMGLPLRPGKSKCGFYQRYGFCGYGPACKFDHPIAAPQGIVTAGLSATSPALVVVHPNH